MPLSAILVVQNSILEEVLGVAVVPAVDKVVRVQEHPTRKRK
jgi:hypothetical protein